VRERTQSVNDKYGEGWVNDNVRNRETWKSKRDERDMGNTVGIKGGEFTIK
jgi:hypothetical protein